MVVNQVTDDPHIVDLRGRVDRLEGDVADIKMGVQKLLDRPVAPGFNAVASTLLTTLAVMGMIMGFAEWRLTRATEPLESTVVALDSRQREIDDRVWQNKLLDAVLEERSRWLESKLNVTVIAK